MWRRVIQHLVDIDIEKWLYQQHHINILILLIYIYNYIYIIIYISISIYYLQNGSQSWPISHCWSSSSATLQPRSLAIASCSSSCDRFSPRRSGLSPQGICHGVNHGPTWTIWLWHSTNSSEFLWIRSLAGVYIYNYIYIIFQVLDTESLGFMDSPY